MPRGARRRLGDSKSTRAEEGGIEAGDITCAACTDAQLAPKHTANIGGAKALQRVQLASPKLEGVGRGEAEVQGRRLQAPAGGESAGAGRVPHVRFRCARRVLCVVCAYVVCRCTQQGCVCVCMCVSAGCFVGEPRTRDSSLCTHVCCLCTAATPPITASEATQHSVNACVAIILYMQASERLRVHCYNCNHQAGRAVTCKPIAACCECCVPCM